MRRSYQNATGRMMHEIPSAEMLSLTRNYRHSFSNPLIKSTTAKCVKKKTRTTSSFPAEILHRSKEIRRQHDKNVIPFDVHSETLSITRMHESEGTLSHQQQTYSKIFNRHSEKIEVPRTVKKVKKANSIDTPSLMSNKSSLKEIDRPLDEYPLYRIINEAVGDIATFMHSKRNRKVQNVSKQEDGLEAIFSEDFTTRVSKDPLTMQDFNLPLRPLPLYVGRHLKRKCSLWSLHSKSRLETSLTVHASSMDEPESLPETTITETEDVIQTKIHPSKVIELVKTLEDECQSEFAINRNLRRHMFPFRINPEDFPFVHSANICIRKRFLQKLIGHDTAILNFQPSMLKIHSLIVEDTTKKIETRKVKLAADESKRLRILQMQGLIDQHYYELETATKNLKLSEKPHVSFDSQRPIFKENPFANFYKCTEENQNILSHMHDGPRGAVEVSHGATTFYDINFEEDANVTNSKSWPSMNKSTPTKSDVTDGNSSMKFVSNINESLSKLEKEDCLMSLYDLSECLMSKQDTTPRKISHVPI